MNGFELISHHNGWVMAGLGAIIVFTGLAALSLAVSQMPRIIRLFDMKGGAGKKPAAAPKSAPTPAAEALPIPDSCPVDLNASAGLFVPLIEQLGEPFQLTELYRLSNEHDLPHPHLTINCMRYSGMLVPQGDGAFTLDKDQLER